MWGASTKEVYFIKVLEAKWSQSRCQEDWFLWGLSLAHCPPPPWVFTFLCSVVSVSPLLLRTSVVFGQDLNYWLAPWKESDDQPRQHIKKQRHYFANEGPSSQGYGFSSGHVWMWELDCEEIWALKNWCFWTVVLEKTLESPLVCKEIQSVHPKGDQSWLFIGRTDAEAETPILWPPDVENWLIWKDSDAGNDQRWEKGSIEDEMVGWHHQLNGRELEWTLGDGQGSLECCSPWDHKELDMTERLNWTETSHFI